MVLVVLQASLRMNQRAIVKGKLEILSRGRLGYINQLVQFGRINILQNWNAYFSWVFGGNWEGKLSSFVKLTMGILSGCFVFMFSSSWCMVHKY